MRDEIQWFQPLSEPIRDIARLIEAGNIFVDEPPAVVDEDELEWFQALSGPVPLPIWRQPEFWFQDQETLSEGLRDEIQWWSNFAMPVLPRQSVANLPAFFIDPEALGEPAVVSPGGRFLPLMGVG